MAAKRIEVVLLLLQAASAGRLAPDRHPGEGRDPGRQRSAGYSRV